MFYQTHLMIQHKFKLHTVFDLFLLTVHHRFTWWLKNSKNYFKHTYLLQWFPGGGRVVLYTGWQFLLPVLVYELIVSYYSEYESYDESFHLKKVPNKTCSMLNYSNRVVQSYVKKQFFFVLHQYIIKIIFSNTFLMNMIIL